MINEILNYCKAVKNNRDHDSVFLHSLSEMTELDEELELKANGESPGPDGIIGESIDVILCMVDLIYQEDPDITEEQIREIALKKCKKWKDIYHEGN